MTEPSLYNKVRDYMANSSWVMPAFGIAAAAPVIGGILDKYNRKRAWKAEMRRRYLMEQMPSRNPLSSLRPPQLMEADYMPELMRKASEAVSAALDKDPVDNLGAHLAQAKERKKKGPKGYLAGFDQAYTGDDQPEKTTRKYPGGTVSGAGPNVIGGGY